MNKCMTSKNQLIHMHKYLCWHVNTGIVWNSYLCKDSVTKKLNCKKMSTIKDELTAAISRRRTHKPCFCALLLAPGNNKCSEVDVINSELHHCNIKF